GPGRADDLLATMVYPPAVGRLGRPALWGYRGPVAAAPGLGQLDGGWGGSGRRQAPLSPAHGPPDRAAGAPPLAPARPAPAPGPGPPGPGTGPPPPRRSTACSAACARPCRRTARSAPTRP